MKKQNYGQIIVISSDRGFNAIAKTSIYAASKHAIQGMISAVRQELKGTGVKLATINPASIDTEWFPTYDPDKPDARKLDVDDVFSAIQLIINQGDRSDIDHILIPLKSN